MFISFGKSALGSSSFYFFFQEVSFLVQHASAQKGCKQSLTSREEHSWILIHLEKSTLFSPLPVPLGKMGLRDVRNLLKFAERARDRIQTGTQLSEPRRLLECQNQHKCKTHVSFL